MILTMIIKVLNQYLSDRQSFWSAIVERLLPIAEKKLPSEPISSLLRSLDIATESKLAKATNSQPESDAKEEKNSWQFI